jgi:hypothetical protein
MLEQVDDAEVIDLRDGAAPVMSAAGAETGGEHGTVEVPVRRSQHAACRVDPTVGRGEVGDDVRLLEIHADDGVAVVSQPVRGLESHARGRAGDDVGTHASKCGRPAHRDPVRGAIPRFAWGVGLALTVGTHGPSQPRRQRSSVWSLWTDW